MRDVRFEEGSSLAYIDVQAVGNPDSSWTVSLQRQTGGEWLIMSYGNG